MKLLISVLLLGTTLSCTHQTENNSTTSSPTPQQPRNSVDVVKATAAPVEIKPNQTAEATVQVVVQSGYHINANPPTFSYLRATELQLNSTPPISVNFIVYPNPITKKFPFADKPLAVYEGTTTIKASLKADGSAKAGAQNLSAKLRVQACDDQVCYAPGTLDLSIPLTIK